MEEVLIDMGFGPARRDQKQSRHRGNVELQIISRLWEIDKEYGKSVCRIGLDIPPKSIYIDFCPSHNFSEELIDKLFECELKNDKFLYSNPKLGLQRNPQFWRKLERCKSIIQKWEQKAKNELGYKPATLWDKGELTDNYVPKSIFTKEE